MKKIVPRLLIVSSQILIGALFVFFTVNRENEVELKTYSKEMVSLSKFVYKENTQVDNSVVDNNKVIIEHKSEEVEILPAIKEENIVSNFEEVVKNDDFMENKVIDSFTGILTGYGPDCVGCGNYKTNKVSTASGYHIADIVDGSIQPAFTITYNDNEYGEVRIVAGDSTLPFKTIVRITIPNKEPIIAIVLDRGSTVGFENCRSQRGCLTNFDLLYPTEAESLGKTQNVLFEILRMGE